MHFDWDPTKSARNYRERGFDFAVAAQIFVGFTLERVDARRDYGESRVIAVGEVAGFVFTVVYTDRTVRAGDVIRRIISARRSNRHERTRYEKAKSST